MSIVKKIPELTRKLIMQEAGMKCPFCKESNVAALEFHHIQGKKTPTPHESDNLIYVCKNCHGKITAGVISKDKVIEKKNALKKNKNQHSIKTETSQVINVSGGENQGIIANVVNIRSKTKRTPSVIPPKGAIASDVLKQNYLKHIIEKYQKFAKAEKKSSFKYPVIYTNITGRFGANWNMIPIQQFDDVCDYVKIRIDKTKLGRIRKSHNQKNYSTFSEYCEKYTK
jgi:HNH endonuclease